MILGNLNAHAFDILQTSNICFKISIRLVVRLTIKLLFAKENSLFTQKVVVPYYYVYILYFFRTVNS